MRKLFFLLSVSTGVCLFSVTQSPAQQNTNPLDDLFDNRRRGLFLGRTGEYGITQSGLSILADRFNEDDKFDNSNSRSMSGSVQWRLGYAVSENMGFYITSLFLSIQPAFGGLFSSQQYPDIYYTVQLGYTRMAAASRITAANFDQYILTDGRRDGAWTFWHENGQKATEGTYTDGRRTGVWAAWREDGQQDWRINDWLPELPDVP